MKVIFVRDLARIGRKNEVKNVSDGHAMNFLIPNGYAIVATAQAEKDLAKMKSVLETEAKIHLDLLKKNLTAVSETRLKISAKVNEKGHLFSGIHKEQIASELKSQAHIQVPVHFIHLDKPLKEVGEHKIKIGEGENVATLVVEVTAA